MLIDTNQTPLAPLPKVFEGTAGQVDEAFLRSICSVVPKPGKRIRELLSACGIKISPSDDVYPALSRQVTRPEFRHKWYIELSNGRVTFSPLYYLAMLYVQQRHKNLGFKSAELADFFTRRKVRGETLTFPILEKIGLLVAQLSDVGRTSPRDAALYAWSLIENTDWGRVKLPHDPSLLGFESTLLQALNSGANKPIHDLLTAVSWDCLQHSFVPSSTEKTAVPRLPPEVEEVASNVPACHPLSMFLEEKLDQITGLLHDYEKYQRSLILKTGELASSVSPEQVLDEIKSQASALTSCLQNLKSIGADAQATLWREANAAAEAIKLQIITPPQSELLPSRSASWLAELTGALGDLLPFLEVVGRISAKPAKVQNALRGRLPEAASPLNAVEKYAQSILTEINKIEAGHAAEKHFQQEVRAKFLDFSWNPLTSSSFSHADWIDLGNILVSEERYNVQLGVALRMEHSALAAAFVTQLGRTLEQLTLVSIEALLNVFRCLTLGQIEVLDRETKSIKPFLAIIELHAYLETNELFPTEAFAYWSASPLNEYATQPSDDPFAQFFQAVFTRSGGPNSSRLALTDFRHYLLDRSSPNNVKEPVSVREPLLQQLAFILRYHKRGANTYAELWSQAHATLFTPIKTLLDNDCPAAAITAIRTLEGNFDIENHLPTWKMAIAEHLRKRSEYDKHIRAQVRSKIDELSSWADNYEAIDDETSFDSNANLDDLRNAIEKVYTTKEYSCLLLQTWFTFVVSAEGSREIPWCPSPTISSNTTAIAHGKKHSPFLPRTVGKQNITFGDILGDEFICSYGFNTAEQLAQAYAAHHMYETYFALAANSPDVLSPDLDRRVEAEIDDLALAQERRINMLQDKQKVLTDSSEDLQSYILELNRYLSEQQWEALDRELSEVERLVSTLEAQQTHRNACDAIRMDIERLGGVAPIGATPIGQLREIYNELYKETSARRKHIEPLRVFLTTEDIQSEVAALATEAISELETSAVLPSSENSAYLSYVLEQAILPLADELSRHRTLLPAYSSRLLQLTLTLISNIRSKDFLTEEGSALLLLLEDTADIWANLRRSGETGIIALEKKFVESGIHLLDGSAKENYEIGPTANVSHVNHAKSDALLDRLMRKIEETNEVSGPYGATANDLSLNSAIQSSEWRVAREIASRLYGEVQLKESRRGIEVLTNWAICTLMSSDDLLESEDIAAILHLINLSPNAAAFRAISPTKNSRGLVGEIITRLIRQISASMGFAPDRTGAVDQLQFIASNISYFSQYRSLLDLSFSPPKGSDSVALKAFWDYFSGDGKQAEVRSSLMNLLWTCSMSSALACCLTYHPTDISRRKADALADIAVQAFEQGRLQLLQSFIDLRKSLSSKPFQLFVDSMLKRVPVQSEPAAQLTLLGKVERRALGTELHALIEITGRTADCPDTISVSLSTQAPVRFKGGKLEMTLIGPFVEATTRAVEFVLADKRATTFNVELSCVALSITGLQSRFSSVLNIDLSEVGTFTRLSSDDLEEAFSDFPEHQMRGAEYVPRWDDERRIERALFASKTVRSVWIASPRRSGKTTMLYKILDSYSHKVGRDSAVAYLTLDKSFTESSEFNSWIWTRLRTIPANKELRERYVNFDELGKDLPWTADAGTFVGALADQLLQTDNATSRVIFLIDEVDKFASMYFAGGSRREAATDIMWQLRQLIGERRDVGFVFAGSSAAKRIFVTNSDSPFFNGITLLELTPFSCKTARDEDSARAIVQPRKATGRYTLPRESLEHLLWVCAGIPYYMKLVAGATMGVARQSHILVSDVNDGLRALLSKTTGVNRLDDMTGDPGSDELRTMAIEKGDEKLLTLAVLYSIAEIYSPLGGHTILRSNLTAIDSPLIARYGFSKKMIDRGLQLCIELGLLRLSSEKHPEIGFAIPILGESIRHSCGKLWAAIDHELRVIGESEATSNA